MWDYSREAVYCVMLHLEVVHPSETGFQSFCYRVSISIIAFVTSLYSLMFRIN